MKLFFSLLVITILYSCGSTSLEKHIPKPSDTTQIIGIFEVGPQRLIRMDYLFRITKDTFTIVKTDTTSDGITQKKGWSRDTIYFAPFLDTVKVADSSKPLVMKDSAATGGWARMIPKLDTAGKPVMQVKWILFPKQFVWHTYEKTQTP